MSTVAVDEHLVAALCRAAAVERGDADTVVRAHLRRVAPLAGPDAGEALVRAAVARLTTELAAGVRGQHTGR